MDQPTPPGDNVPLIEGMDSSWNEIVNYIPEDKRAEFGPKFKERVTGLTSQYEPLKQWEDLQKSGITAEHAGTALNIFSQLENNPRQVLDTIAQHLGLSISEAQQLEEVMEDPNEDDDPRIAALQKQVETMAQILLGQRDQTMQEQQIAQQEAELDKQLASLQKKYSDVDEEQVVMRMLHKGMTAEEAYQDYVARDTQIRSKRPSPMLMGGGGSIPSKQIDPTKLDSKGAKGLVAEMLRHANQASK